MGLEPATYSSRRQVRWCSTMSMVIDGVDSQDNQSSLPTPFEGAGPAEASPGFVLLRPREIEFFINDQQVRTRCITATAAVNT